ncbi:MAG: hypothetical protein V4558_16440 [Gemmatimonadota bacterium]
MTRFTRWTLALLAAAPSAAAAQGASIAPHAVVIDDRLRSSTVTLYNPGALPIEVTVGTAYGFPVTDSTGQFTLRCLDDSTTGSASRWITAYPRRFTLPPLARQTVRLLARPPQELSGGEYWARLAVTTRAASTPVERTDSAGIQVGLALEVRTLLPIYYRKGPMTTSLSFDAASASRLEDSVAFRLLMHRDGNAAFIGQVHATLVDSAGRVVREGRLPIAVYQSAEPRLQFPSAGLGAGHYRLRLEARTERPDADVGALIQAPPVRAEFDILL